ncbi:MAG: DUF4115 domain-containing protein [Rhodobacterales bacterium]|nr:DUF4115 domain-containing protein [Rhodobacterales bacterium]
MGLSALVAVMFGAYVSERPSEFTPFLNEGQSLDQSVSISVRRNTRLRVWVDEVLVADRNVTNGERFEFQAKDKLEVEIQAADSVRIEYNGNRIVPQGRQGEPRRLVFVDDVGDVR